MKTASGWVLGFGAMLAVAACGGEVDSPAVNGETGAGGGTSTSTSTSATTSTGSGSGATTGGSTTGTGGPEDLKWTPLITANWELDPGSEKTNDNHSITVDKDMYIGAIRPIAPTGTHHTVLARGENGDGFIAGNILYASGVGTNALVFPKGVGLKVSVGDKLTLQLHLFNASFDPLKGTSGIEVVEIDPADIEDEADLLIPGPFDFSIPPNQEYSYSGKCTTKKKQNIFAIFPHMHQLGTHLKTTLNVGGAEKVIHDDDYTFDHQAFIPFETIALDPGDTIKTECTWKNTTAKTVSWGESSTTEMCFSILYRYPAQGGGPSICIK